MNTIVKATTKGQITLPAKWRRNFKTSQYILTEKGNRLEIAPLDLNQLRTEEYYTVFDAIRDNNGKGIKAKDLLTILKKMR